MKKSCILCACLVLAAFVSCQKQQTEEERKAEVDRQVEQRLAAEHQAQEKEQLAQREAELNAREKALSEKQNTPVSTPIPQRRVNAETQPREDSDESAGYNTFYTKLEPYGDWRETSDYGFVWQPRAAADSRNWHPYTEGRWVYTDAGWTWVSEEPFGWATYHYGRWARLRNVGWVWVPGDEWAPAWVSWRKSDDYVGWAPLPPEARFDHRRGIKSWSDNYYDVGPEQYRFVSTREFGARQIERTIVPQERNITIISQTTNVTDITYNNTVVVNQGPSYDELRTRSQQPIERLRLEREVNFDPSVAAPRSVVRGEIVAVPAPIITIGRSIERPRHVKEPIAQVVVEHGWEGADRQASEQARTKMKSEATPPSDAPSRTFVKPAVAAQKTSPPAATAAPAESVVPPPTATATPTAMASASPIASASIPPATRTPPRRFSPMPRSTPSPAVIPSVAPTSTPVVHSTPTPSTPMPEATTPLPRQRSTPPAVIVPPAHKLSPTPPSSEDASDKPSPRQRLPQKNPSRLIEQPPPSPTPSPVATATASAAARSTSTPSPKTEAQATAPAVREPRHLDRKRPEATGSISPSPSPAPQ
jgi:hypothetical protein